MADKINCSIGAKAPAGDDPKIIDAALQKLEKHKELGKICADKNVEEDEAALLNMVEDNIVGTDDLDAINSGLNSRDKLTEREFVALARSFKTRFPESSKVKGLSMLLDPNYQLGENDKSAPVFKSSAPADTPAAAHDSPLEPSEIKSDQDAWSTVNSLFNSSLPSDLKSIAYSCKPLKAADGEDGISYKVDVALTDGSNFSYKWDGTFQGDPTQRAVLLHKEGSPFDDVRRFDLMGGETAAYYFRTLGKLESYILKKTIEKKTAQ